MHGPSRALAALLGCLLIAPAARATEDAPAPADAERLRGLVRQLGDPRFAVRDAAAGELVGLGRAAKAVLLEGTAAPDPEVRDRCRQLLPMAMEIDLKARIDAFAADAEGKEQHHLPGWERFRELAGADRAGRALFADMLHGHGLMFEEIEADPSLLPARYHQRALELQQYFNLVAQTGSNNRAAPPRADIAALLFLGTDPRLKDGAEGDTFLANVFYQPLFRTALTAGDAAPALRKLLLGWIDRRRSAAAVQQSMYLIVQCDLKEALPVAVKIARDEKVPVHARGMAALAVGKFGGKRQAADLEPLLGDETVLGTFQFNNVRGTTQLRDVALAMSVHLTGQKLADYGFDMLRNQPLNFSYYYNLGFSDDSKREEAHKKWGAWKSRQKE